MVYRAKITTIQGWVLWHYNMDTHTIVRDAKDAYLEVKDEKEAELLETMNQNHQARLWLENEWFKKYENK